MNAAPSKPKAPAKASSTAASPAPAKVSAKAAPASPDGLPVRSARPSSRLAQLTVPSIQQSVASTAAKASYTNTMPTTLQAPRAAAPKKDPKLANHWKTKPLEELTDAERQELAAWFDARQSAKAERMNQYRASIGGQTLADLADAIRAGGTLTDDQAAAVWRGLADVAKALRKAGHPKPKRERPAPVALPGQADLLADAAEPAPAVLPPASTGV